MFQGACDFFKIGYFKTYEGMKSCDDNHDVA